MKAPRSKLNDEQKKERNREHWREWKAKQDPEKLKARQREKNEKFRAEHPSFWQDYYERQKERDIAFNRKRSRHATRLQHFSNTLDLLAFVMPDVPLSRRRELAKQVVENWRVLPQLDKNHSRFVGDYEKQRPYVTNVRCSEGRDGADVYELNLKCDGRLVFADKMSERGIIRLIVESKGEKNETTK